MTDSNAPNADDDPPVAPTPATLELTVRNVGGIAEATVTLSPGVTLLSGRNASNKSSLLRSLAGVLGGPTPPLKSDAETGSVRLTVGDEEYHLTLERDGDDAVVADARRYAEAGDLCELFVAQTETNPIRRAVLAGDDLYDLLMRPVDTDRIEADIERLRTEKARLDDRLDDLDSMESRLPGLRTRRETLAEELSAVEATLRDRRETVAELEAEVAADDPDADELSDKRAERTELTKRIRTQEAAIDSLDDERSDVDDRLDEIDDSTADATVDEIGAVLDDLHDRKRELTATINALSPIVEMNGRFLDGGAEIPDAMVADDAVAELDPDSKVLSCWTCGSTVERAAMERQLDAVREIVWEKRNEREAVTERIESLADEKATVEARRDERDRLETRRDELTAEIERRRETVADLEADRRALESEIGALQAAVEERTSDQAELSDLYEEISDLEYERGGLANDLEGVEAEIDEIESALADRSAVERERETVAERLRERRERIDEAESELVATFNEMMQRALERLAYRSIERVWIERLSTGDRVSGDTEFDLRVARTTDDGTVYEDTVDSLSKSEREVIGLVVSLAGYIVHDVAETVPFVVVDAVEMFDADRIRGLVEQFGDHADYVVTAILPEERRELDGTYDTITTAPFAADP